MNFRNVLMGVLVWIACCVGSSALFAAEAEPIVTLSSSGKYQTAWLQLEQGGVDFDGKAKDRCNVPLFLGLRDGKAVVAWFVHPALAGGRVMWLDSSSLMLKGDKLSGSLNI